MYVSERIAYALAFLIVCVKSSDVNYNKSDVNISNGDDGDSLSTKLDFKSLPTTVQTRENSSLLLPCYMETNNNDDVQQIRITWYKESTVIADSGPPDVSFNERFKLWPNGSLEVARVQPIDTAEYTCEIHRNPPWGPIRQVHAIQVIQTPTIRLEPASGFLEVKLGEEARMACHASGVPHPIVSWSSNGEDIIQFNNHEVIKIQATDRQMAGDYECHANNGIGEPVHGEITLNIIYPPELITSRSWIHSAPGLRAQLECRVSADPQAQVTWLKSEMPVLLNERVVTMNENDKHILIISNVQRSDFGIYTCRATNDLGQGETQIQLSGVPNPGVFKETNDKNEQSKTSYTLIWEVDSYTPIIEYNLWYRPYRPTNKPEWTKLTIPTEHNSNAGTTYSKTYTIKGLKEKSAYEALLVSRNRYGWSRVSPIKRFATLGAENREEMLIPVQTDENENTIIPSEFTSSNAAYHFRIIYVAITTLLFIINL